MWSKDLIHRSYVNLEHALTIEMIKYSSVEFREYDACKALAIKTSICTDFSIYPSEDICYAVQSKHKQIMLSPTMHTIIQS